MHEAPRNKHTKHPYRFASLRNESKQQQQHISPLPYLPLASVLYPTSSSSDSRPGVGKAEILQANFSLANVTLFQPLLWCLHGVGNSYQDLYGLTCNLEVHACIRHGREKKSRCGLHEFCVFFIVARRRRGRRSGVVVDWSFALCVCVHGIKM